MNEIFTFNDKDMNRYAITKKLISKHISEEEARKMLGLRSVRQVRRIKRRIIEEGAKGVLHRNKGRPGNRRLNENLLNKAMSIVRSKYADFRPTLASEKLMENHDIRISKEKMRQMMMVDGLWRAKKRRAPKHYRTWRARKENYGEMEQFDGSYEHWFEDRGPECCLLLAIDDATGDITHAKFDVNEGVKAVFKFWLEYNEKNGLPISIYLDKFSTYKINHAAAVDNRELLTQFERAMKQVSVNVIHAHSPEAKGRVERMNGTLQDRLIKEMRLANICTIEEGNKFLGKYIPVFNKKFAVVPAKSGNLHKVASRQISQIFSVQSTRRVNNDYTVIFKNQFLQLAEEQPVTVYKRDIVTIEEHLNGELKICFKGKYLKFSTLPERPKKISILLPAITTKKTTGFVPPENHPWRRFRLPNSPTSCLISK